MVGILALQGAYQKHYDIVQQLGQDVCFVRTPKEFSKVDKLIVPGGESTTIGKLMNWYGLLEPIKKHISEGMPVFGTCAGLILLAKKVDGFLPYSLGAVDITVERNAYGSQIDSFEVEIMLNSKCQIDKLTPAYAKIMNSNSSSQFNAIFIRAPRIIEVGKNVDILLEYDGNPILVKEKNILAATFHPELTDDTGIHEIFLNI
jgi:5'-phosphate synthase pdxT subunit